MTLGTTLIIFTTQAQSAEAAKDHRLPEKIVTPPPAAVRPDDDQPLIPPIPEPAGLGLIGLAMLALRTKRH